MAGVAAGTDTPRLLVAGGEDPAISPDGLSVFWIRRSGGGSELRIGAADGSKARRLASRPDGLWRYPVSTPGARALLVLSARGGAGITAVAAALEGLAIVPRTGTGSLVLRWPWGQ